ncbi:MAG: hypothetical protein WAN23_04405 [Candidatus Acidiferrales bacterium]
MSNQAILGLLIIGGFLTVCIGEGVAIIILSYKLGIYKGKLARYELAEKQASAVEQHP